MNEAKRTGRAAAIRPLVLLLVLVLIGYFIWRYYDRREDYRGGNVQTTGTVEAEQVQLGFQARAGASEQGIRDRAADGHGARGGARGGGRILLRNPATVGPRCCHIHRIRQVGVLSFPGHA